MGYIDKTKRVIHRCYEELVATKMISEVTSIREGLETLRAKKDMRIMNHNGNVENEIRRDHLMRKHDIMMRYYEKTFIDYLDNYDYNHNESILQPSIYSNCIWVCWWQGLDQAPPLVKACIESIKRNSGSHQVIIITDDNYRDYVNLPDWVEQKRDKGIITRTNYSDLLRLSLLAEYGGMWLDATFFCTEPEPLDLYFSEPLWSIKRPEYNHASVASGYFAGYSLSCQEINRFAFITMRDFFLNYWKHNDTMVDYLMVDYMIVLAQKHDSRIAKLFNDIKPNNPECDELVKLLNEPYDDIKWKKIKSDTCLFKLSWKQKYVEEKDGKPTFYKYLLERKL